MIEDKYKTSLSKTISYILRHHPEDFSLKMEIDGTIKIKSLLKALQDDNRFKNIEFDDLKSLADNDKKNRFTIINNDDEKRIKANYGHSIEGINLDYENIKPPQFLYHGTTKKYYDQIIKEGIKKMGRNYVHLSKTKKQARQVGKRRTRNPIILKINAEEMYNDGCSFFKTNSDIILTEFVGSKYIKKDN